MKKLFSLMLALMMLAMSVSALAEGPADLIAADPTTAALEAGRRVESCITITDVNDALIGDPAIDAVIADVLEALDIDTAVQGDETSFALKLSGQDILTLGFTQSGDDTYVASNLLGNTIVVAKDEVQPMLERLIDMFVTMGAITERDAAEIKAQLPEIFAQFETELANAAALEEIDVLSLDFSAFINAAAPLMEKVQMGEVTAQPRNSDPASTMITLTVTPDEFKALIKSFFQFMKDNPEFAAAVQQRTGYTDAMLAAEFGEGTTFMTMMDQLMAELDTENLLAADGTIAIYLDDAGMPVYATLLFPIEDLSTAEGYSNLEITFAALTQNDGPTYTVTMKADKVDMTVNVAIKGENHFIVTFAMAENGETLMDMLMDMTVAENGNTTDVTAKVDINLYNVDDDADVSIVLDITGKTVTNGIDFTDDTAVVISVNGMKILTLNISSKTTDPTPSIMSGNVVRPAELNDADFANWFVGVINGLTGWLGNVVTALPESALMLIMEMQ